MDAEVPSMPENAAREVAIDYSIPVAEMARLLVRLSSEEIKETSEVVMEDDKKTAMEIRIAAADNAFEMGVMNLGEPSPFTCPDCHGVLLLLKDGEMKRYRCHTGHAYSADSLLATVTENIEDSLYSAIRGVEESIMLLNHMGDHFAETNSKKLAALYFQKAKEAEQRAQFVRRAVLSHEQLSKDSLLLQAENDNYNNE
jgi:two-component system chemotaxis response regulator CheB